MGRFALAIALVGFLSALPCSALASKHGHSGRLSDDDDEVTPPSREQFDDAGARTAEEELGDISSPAYTIYRDMRFDAVALKGGGAAGTRLIIEGIHLGFDFGFSGIVTRESGNDLVARGLLDASFAVAPVSGQRGRIRIEAGVAAIFSPCMNAAGPQLGLSGEVRLLGPVGVQGTARVVPWPYRSLDWTAALQVSLRAVDLRAGLRQFYLGGTGAADGSLRPESFLGPWMGIGIRI